MQIRLKSKNIYANHQNKYEHCRFTRINVRMSHNITKATRALKVYLVIWSHFLRKVLLAVSYIVLFISSFFSQFYATSLPSSHFLKITLLSFSLMYSHTNGKNNVDLILLYRSHVIIITIL